MAKYKIKVIKMGGYLSMLYVKKHWWSKWKHISQSLHNHYPYSEQVASWQKEYGIPDNRVKFDICR